MSQELLNKDKDVKLKKNQSFLQSPIDANFMLKLKQAQIDNEKKVDSAMRAILGDEMVNNDKPIYKKTEALYLTMQQTSSYLKAFNKKENKLFSSPDR
jgi:hypothetical protein